MVESDGAEVNDGVCVKLNDIVVLSPVSSNLSVLSVSRVESRCYG